MPEVFVPSIQWFPGHMTRAFRTMESEKKNVDVIVEIVDARIPKSSRNPEFDRIFGGMPRVLFLNKSDLADPAATKQWEAYYKGLGYGVLSVNSKGGKLAGAVYDAVREKLADKIAAQQARGITGARVRAMIVGIPNAGKSTFINNIAGSRRANAEDRPGVTRGKQWITVAGMDLLDMPGVLWPKLEDREGAAKLACTGAIRDEILNVEELAIYFLYLARTLYPGSLQQRYGLPEELPEDNYELLQQIARRRGMVIRKGEPDTERAANMLLDEFRGGKLGRLTLEVPPL